MTINDPLENLFLQGLTDARDRQEPSFLERNLDKYRSGYQVGLSQEPTWKGKLVDQEKLLSRTADVESYVRSRQSVLSTAFICAAGIDTEEGKRELSEIRAEISRHAYIPTHIGKLK